MRRLSDPDIQKINDFAIESEASLPPYVLEKDMHVLEAMRAMLTLPANKHFKLVFCGGTCLSKAYGILERMSEDVDFKVEPTAEGLKLSNNDRRKELSSFGKSVVAALRDAGFTGDDAVSRVSRDENKYTRIEVDYESAFDKPESLRAHLLIEMNYTPLLKPAINMEVGSLLDRLITGSYAKPFKMDCVSLEEALAEKLISFPRRLGKLMADQLPKGGAGPKKFDDAPLSDDGRWDKSLVRHLFDVQAVLSKHPELIADPEAFGGVLAAVIKKDADDFKNSHDDYTADPVKELQAAMVFAASSRLLEAQYEKFVADMVYGTDKPSFAEAISHFDSTLKTVLASRSLQASLAAGPAAKPVAATKSPARLPSR